ncbi:MAG TPA: COR domain-containing protein [Blastocatellia bacterium]|nr:COR domain-containing protein [Blastocatellia bacterium]
MSYEIAQQRIDAARSQGSARLNLSALGLQDLPPELFALAQLRVLWLSDNQLICLPPEIGALRRLERLRLNKNALDALPTEIGELTELRELWLHDNQLTALPDEFWKLNRLRSLVLNGNRLAELPGAISQLQELRTLGLGSWIWLRGKQYDSDGGNRLTSAPIELGQLSQLQMLWLDKNWLSSVPVELCKLSQLQRLVLSNNQLSSVPVELSQLRQLKSLSLDHNRFNTIPVELSQLGQLQRLFLQNNQLTSVPVELGQLSQLQYLILSDNRLSSVPEELGQLSHLEWLWLFGNQLTSAPAGLGQLKKLKEFRISPNPLRYPPEIIESGDGEILAFLRMLDGAKREWISKMVVVGEGGVGKTSLLRALRGESFVADQETTHGIEIKQLPLAHPAETGVTMLLNTWDFGGQEIYHATHQFFLTNRSLYALAWNARLGYEQGKLNYWLDTISVRAPQSPVILVATHTDERDADLPLAELQRSYPQIVGQVEVSNKIGNGVERLRQLVAETAAALPLMGEEWPVAWARVRHAVRELAATRNHITPNELAAQLDEHEVSGTQARVLTKWLHELGEILFFQDEPELNDTVILNSQWVTEAISRVLESEEVIANVGVFSREHMNRLWRDLPPAMREHFLRLMEQFDLSYRILEDRDKSLVIERVPFDPPAYEQRWDDHRGMALRREIRMRFKLDATMPAGIPTWFIARSHRFSLRTHWRHGALLADDRQAPKHLGLIQAFPHDRFLLLTVRGPAPQNFFALLRDGLEVTFARFPGLGITRRVPCYGHDGSPCPHEFDLKQLEKALARTPPVTEIQCPEAFENVPIAQLLYGIDRDTTQQRLEEILAKYAQASSLELQELRTYVQREFTKIFNSEQNKEESRCPYLFALRPVTHERDFIGLFEAIPSAGMLDQLRDKGWKRRMELQLYCQAPGEIHPLGYERGKDNPATGLYQIEVNTEFLATIAPGVKAVAKMLRFVRPTLASWMSWTDDDQYLKQFEDDLKRMQKLGEKIPEALDDTRGSQMAGTMREGYTPQQASGAMLRALKLLLDGKDKQQTWGGLKRILTKEGHHLWLCPHHLAEYKL